eukprot:c54332_g1_i1.p1 GENE.c54332_g1_i1~~c54332_g1_i1.p1  ORF type:complete len:157 (+),score=33.22 c54332_g1_i1:167-637(+)
MSTLPLQGLTYVCATNAEWQSANTEHLKIVFPESVTSVAKLPVSNLCRPVECTPPNAKSVHGELKCSTERFGFGVLCEFKCWAGYHIVGETPLIQNVVTECSASGDWNSTALECEATRCPEAIQVAHATRRVLHSKLDDSNVQYGYNTTVTYEQSL